MTTRFLLILSFFLFPLFSSCGKSDSPVGNEKEDIDDKDPFLAEHPRLLFSAAEEERVRELMVTDPTNILIRQGLVPCLLPHVIMSIA